jgi:uncharacterized protein (TIGR03066 family)
LVFAKGGKVKASAKTLDTDKPLSFEGTYRAEGDKLTVTSHVPGQKGRAETVKIKSLTDKEIVFEDVDGTTSTFKRIK